jgi:hypothetical protein
VLNFVKGFFFCIYWNNHVIFKKSLTLFTCLLICPFEYSYISGMKLTWSCCMILLICYWNWFGSIFIEIFCIYVHQRYWCITFFLCTYLVWYQGDTGFVDLDWKRFFFKVLVELSSKAVWSWIFLFWEAVLLLQSHCLLLMFVFYIFLVQFLSVIYV